MKKIIYDIKITLPVFSLTFRFHFKPFFHCFHPHIFSTNVHVKSPRSVNIDKLICFVQSINNPMNISDINN